MTVLVVFDIEAVPDFEAARRLLAQPDSTPDAEIRRMLGKRYARDGEDPTTAFLKAPIYRIVCIAALNAKREDSGGPWTVTRIGSRSVGEKTEAEVLLGFVKALPVDGRGTGPILVTFGGNGFDLPLLRYRAFALGVPVPELHGAVTATTGIASARITSISVMYSPVMVLLPSPAWPRWRPWRTFRLRSGASTVARSRLMWQQAG
jgi:predicted PolB exonuclease-like 3'-5' exonuclease